MNIYRLHETPLFPSEPPAKENYLLCWCQDHYVTQWHTAGGHRPGEINVNFKGAQIKPPSFFFCFAFSSTTAHFVFKQMIACCRYVNGVETKPSAWIGFVSLHVFVPGPRWALSWCVSVLTDLPVCILNGACELTSEFELGGAGK